MQAIHRSIEMLEPSKRKREEEEDRNVRDPLESAKGYRGHFEPQEPLREEHISSRISSPALTILSDSTPLERSRSPSMPSSAPPVPLATLPGAPNHPNKRVKLTNAEKEQRKVDELAKKEERALIKAQKDAEAEKKKRTKDIEAEEKRRKLEADAEERQRKKAELEEKKKLKEVEDEEKRKAKETKKAEKEKEQKIKEEQKQLKEAEKKRAEDEKLKKQKAQPTLLGFLKISNGAPGSLPRDSLSPMPGDPLQSNPSSPKQINKDHPTEYQRRFLPFHVKENVTLAPLTVFQSDEKHLLVIQSNIDDYLTGEKSLECPTMKPRPFFDPDIPQLSRTPLLIRPVRDIMANIQGVGVFNKPIDLTSEAQNADRNRAMDLLSRTPYKFLRFAEDVRPPYQGTFTKTPDCGLRRLARNPFIKTVVLNYEYDSEAEWEEPEEGEDITSDGEDDEDIDGGDDMNEFIDDEDDELSKARRAAALQSEIEVKCTGICFANQHGVNPNEDLQRYVMQILDAWHGPKLNKAPIDPFSAAYWEAELEMRPPPAPVKSTTLNVHGGQLSLPTFLLHDGKEQPKQHPVAGSDIPLVQESDMATFKEVVSGCDLSKLGLIEVLKKKLPSAKAAAIKNTLERIATRIGEKRDTKRWVLNEDIGDGPVKLEAGEK